MGSQIPSRLCTYCGLEKTRIYSGKRLRDGSRIYTNEFASRWAGRRCPDCERKRVNAAIHCDRFERDMILRELIDQGYTVVSSTLPIKVSKDEREYEVEVRHAVTHDGKITLDHPTDNSEKLYAIVFSSVRLCTTEVLGNLKESMSVYPKSKRPIITLDTQSAPM